MDKGDFPAFTEILDATCALLSRGQYQPNPTNTALWFRSLARYPLHEVRAAFDAHIRDPQRGRFVPVPADIIAQIEGAAEGDGRPGPEEAWAIALACRDESASVTWTDEIAKAWGVASAAASAGDLIGARMAFKESYERHVQDARAERRPVHWSVSLGHDVARRHEEVERAQVTGLISHSTATMLLPPPAAAGPVSPEIRRMLREVRDRIASRSGDSTTEGGPRQCEP